MSNADSDLFSPLDQENPASVAGPVGAGEQQIDALFHMLSSMIVAGEITLRFQRPDGEAKFVLRLLGKDLQ